MAPSKIVAAERMPGRKNSKERISVLACSSDDGSERFGLLIIGSAWKPRSFKHKSGVNPDIDYHANKKA